MHETIILDEDYAYIYNHLLGVFEPLSIGGVLGSGGSFTRNACGFTKDDNGKAEFILVIGGRPGNAVRKFDLRTRQFSSAPDYPITVETPRSVQMGRSFLVLGGHDYNTGEVYDSIYQVDPDTHEWSKRDETLNEGRYLFYVSLVEDDQVLCE